MTGKGAMHGRIRALGFRTYFIGLLIIVMLLLTPGAQAQVLFSDNFDDGDASDWIYPRINYPFFVPPECGFSLTNRDAEWQVEDFQLSVVTNMTPPEIYLHGWLCAFAGWEAAAFAPTVLSSNVVIELDVTFPAPEANPHGHKFPSYPVRWDKGRHGGILFFAGTLLGNRWLNTGYTVAWQDEPTAGWEISKKWGTVGDPDADNWYSKFFPDVMGDPGTNWRIEVSGVGTGEVSISLIVDGNPIGTLVDNGIGVVDPYSGGFLALWASAAMEHIHFDNVVVSANLLDVDVAITQVTNNLPLPNTNAPLKIFATVANTGSVDIASVPVQIFLDVNLNHIFDPGELSSLTTLTDLSVGISQNVVGVFSNPPMGIYQAVAVVDPANLIAESNENNNLGTTPLSVILPDLTVTNGNSSSFLTPGCSGSGNNPNCPKYNVNLQATIANIGGVSASNVQAQFAFSTNGGTSFTNIQGPLNAGAIQAGATVSATNVWNNVAPGLYLIKVTIDPNNQINEGNETNNVTVFTISVP